LQSAADWGVLTPAEQGRRESNAFVEIERDREAELAKLPSS